jgi:hypothetical protein
MQLSTPPLNVAKVKSYDLELVIGCPRVEIVTVTKVLRWGQFTFQVGAATCVDIDGLLSVTGRNNQCLIYCVKY